MRTRMQTDAWIRGIAYILGLILFVSLTGVAISVVMKQSMPGILVALGFVSGAGLGKLLISPLNKG